MALSSFSNLLESAKSMFIEFFCLIHHSRSIPPSPYRSKFSSWDISSFLNIEVEDIICLHGLRWRNVPIVIGSGTQISRIFSVQSAHWIKSAMAIHVYIVHSIPKPTTGFDTLTIIIIVTYVFSSFLLSPPSLFIMPPLSLSYGLFVRCSLTSWDSRTRSIFYFLLSLYQLFW